MFSRPPELRPPIPALPRPHTHSHSPHPHVCPMQLLHAYITAGKKSRAQLISSGATHTPSHPLQVATDPPTPSTLVYHVASMLVVQRTNTPAAPRATGACSREEPQPKFCPPMMTLYFVFISPSSTNLVYVCVEGGVAWVWGGWTGVRKLLLVVPGATPCPGPPLAMVLLPDARSYAGRPTAGIHPLLLQLPALLGRSLQATTTSCYPKQALPHPHSTINTSHTHPLTGFCTHCQADQ